MAGIKCTCSDLTPSINCELHDKKRNVKNINEGYLMVCLCDCKCNHCAYTPLSDIIAEGNRVLVYHFDKNGLYKKLEVRKEIDSESEMISPENSFQNI